MAESINADTGSNLSWEGSIRRIPLYRQAAVSIVPVFYGSGTRVKVIEASRFARPCFSTALGVEGVGLESGVSFFRGESESDWIDGLVRLTSH